MVHDDRRLASRRVPSRRPHQARHLWHQDTIPACPVRCALHACVRAVCEAKVPGLTHRSPSSILFDVPASLGAIITESTARAAEQIADLDLQVRYFEDYGKGFVKRYVCAVCAMCVRGGCMCMHAARRTWVRRLTFPLSSAFRLGVSPDAFVQMALQITYYRNIGNTPLTYESAMARLFKDVRATLQVQRGVTPRSLQLTMHTWRTGPH